MITQQNAETPIGEIPMGRLFAPTFFRWASATATGRLHEVNCEASQDAHALDQFDDPSGNRWLVTAVADGAGSALDGGTGAQIAASAFIEAIALLIAEGKMDDFNIGLKAAVTFARLEIDIVALIAGHDVSHYATTLLGVVTDGNRIGVVQVGDGAVVVGPPWRVVHTPDRGEY
ncbi:MAG: protein phosphatase 2C domain-containing protein, partial [Hyphomicrobium sp.]